MKSLFSKKWFRFFLVFLVIVVSAIAFWKPRLDFGSGSSMEPTLHDGDVSISYSSHHSPKVGDIISFYCPECDRKNKISTCDKDGCSEQNRSNLTKRLIRIDDKGCYWVEGDNKKHSWDSRNFGWLCPSDISFVRTVAFSF